MFSEEVSRKVKQQYLYDVLEGKDEQSATTLYAYAQFLNQHPHRYEHFPLYLKVFETNSRYAIDAMLEGYEPETFFDMVIIPNHFVVKKIFALLNKHKANSLYEKTVRVLCGFISRVYLIVEDGYRIFPPTVNDVNNLAKHLDEEQDQNNPANRVLLNILQSIAGLDNLNEMEKQKLDAGRQANRIRGDFLDNNRTLVQAITDAVLKKADTVDFGIVPLQLR